MKQHPSTVTFALVPRVGCQIFVAGQLVETCSLADKDARLATYGHASAKTSRYGWSASGKIVTKRGK